MFSVNFLNNQTQILLSLSQVSSRHSGYFKHKTHAKQTKARHVNSTPTLICPESFQECLKNNRTLLQELTVDVKAFRRAPNSSKHKPTLSAKPVSYLSNDSFLQNKNGLGWNADILINIGSEGLTLSGLPPSLCHALGGRHLGAAILSTQTRGFKTDRSSVADASRNPSLLQRLRKFFGFQLKDEKAAVSNMDAARLEKLLHDDPAIGSLSPDQKNKIKIAFAEGYLAGSHPDRQRGSKSARYLKLAQQIFMLTLFIALFISLVATVSGTVFRIQIGNQVEVDPEDINVTFNDVKGADEAKDELREVVEFLRSPEKFSALGGKLPKGVLLVGPPGTGKTLLARAVAGEAGVPFFHAAGPEFDEILVGQGARRVRDLFKAAKERAPCVVFIDEIDSVGAKRTNSVLHPYANQTINQLLSEMDGFHQNEGVIVLGATNRKDDLDPALLRPGRFDVEVNVPTPDYTGRKDIIRLYLGRVAAGGDVDVEMLARGTTGFTGADLENMVNQAALKAAIDGAKKVSMKYLEFARDKVLMGPERKSRLPDEEANTITAYHEGGHAIVAYFTKESSPLHKVTIMPRGPSLGHTSYIPSKERYHVTKQQLLAMMDTAMGGRAAEELVFGPDKITSGASSDLKQATGIASQMVKDFGMSERVGLRTYEHPRGFAAAEQLGPNTSEMVDGEIKKILSESYERAKTILRTHTKELKALAEALLKYETLDAEDVKAIMNGGKLRDERPSRISKEREPEREGQPPFLLPTPHPHAHPKAAAHPNPA